MKDRVLDLIAQVIASTLTLKAEPPAAGRTSRPRRAGPAPMRRPQPLSA